MLHFGRPADLARLGAGIILLCLSAPAKAAIVSVTTADNIVANAEYRPGDADKPVVLIVHGFLQTRNFPTVARLANSLNELNYPVLAPTLSLGIESRKSSLACEAIQTHSMPQAVAEIALWVNWLMEKGHSSIVLVGHSAGSTTAVAYLNANPSPAVKKAALISLGYFGEGKASFERESDARRARQWIAQGKTELDTYALAFCKTYVARPEDFLSYYSWSKGRSLRALEKATTPVYAIIGGADERMDREWVHRLGDSHVTLITVPGANHFFDDVHEFDLLDQMERILDMP